MSAANALDYLVAARLLSVETWERKCFAVIDAATAAVLSSAGFLTLSHELLGELLARETLTIREVELFEAALRWASAECRRREMPASATNQRAVLGEAALRSIRFTAMSAGEFAAGVGEKRFFSPYGLYGHFPASTVIRYRWTVITDRI